MRFCPSPAVLAIVFQVLNCLLTFPALTGSVSAAEGDVQLLEELRARNVENLQLLKTWTGHAKIHDVVKIGEFEQQCDFQLSFGWDQAGDRWYFVMKCVKHEASGSGADGDFNLVNTETGVLYKDKNYFTYSSSAPTPDGILPQAVVQDAVLKKKLGPFSVFFDPRSVFNVRADPAETRLANLIKVWGAAWNGSTVQRDGDLVSLAEINKGVPDAKADYKFDLGSGGNLVYSICADDTTTETTTREWQEVAGVWVPKEVLLTNKSGMNSNSRQITWEKQTVNEPLADQMFELETLGVQPGASFTDKITGKSYVYREADLAPPQALKSIPAKPKAPEKRGPTGIFLAVNLALILAIICYVLFRKQKGNAGTGGA